MSRQLNQDRINNVVGLTANYIVDAPNKITPRKLRYLLLQTIDTLERVINESVEL